MALANILRAVAILAAAVLVATDRMTLALLIIIVLVNAGGTGDYYSSLQAMVPELVKNDALERANGVLTAPRRARSTWRVPSSEPLSSP